VFYYIGEAHIDKFYEFLKIKEKKMSNNGTNFSTTTNRIKSMKLNGRVSQNSDNNFTSKVELFL
jgi:hypothetical protein